MVNRLTDLWRHCAHQGEAAIRRLTTTQRIVLVAALTVLLAVGVYWSARSSSDVAAGALFEVRKSDLTVKITEPGDLRAMESVTILSRKDGPIAYVVPEGTQVKPGDIVVRFDSTQQETALAASQVDLAAVHAELRRTEKDIEVQGERLRAELARLRAEVRLAEVELADLKKKPLPDEAEKARLELEKARVSFDHAERKGKLLPELAQKGFITQSTLDEAEVGHLAAKATLRVAQFNLAKVSAGATPEELEKATIKLRQARFMLEVAEATHAPQLQALQAALEKQKLAVQKSRSVVDKVKEDLEATRLRAPQAGLVLYATRGGGADKIYPGVMSWAGQSLVHLPDMSTMVADTEVNELDIGRVRPGAPVEVRLEAYPGAVFRGRVVQIGTVARFKRSRAGAASSVKVFDVTVRIEDKDPRVKPGLTAILDIIVDHQKDVMTVPLSAVVSRAGGQVVYVATNGRVEERTVVLGASNDRYVVVKDGVRVGERVLVDGFLPRRR